MAWANVVSYGEQLGIDLCFQITRQVTPTNVRMSPEKALEYQ